VVRKSSLINPRGHSQTLNFSDGKEVKVAVQQTANTVVAIDNMVADVGDRVASVDDRVRLIDDRVAGVVLGM
jgi:hypothetical protein